MTAETFAPTLADYLRMNREFVAPLVDEAIARLGLLAGARALDAGTGAGGAAVALARAVGETGRVLAVDNEQSALEAAAEHVKGEGLEHRIELRAADLGAALTENSAFDVIFAGDVVWPGNFDSPPDLVEKMASALRPNGQVALFYSNYYRATFLPGHPQLERKLKTASELQWNLPSEGEIHYEKHCEWLRRAGLHDVAVHVVPYAVHPVAPGSIARQYLEIVVWPELLSSAAAHADKAGISPSELAQAQRLLDPGQADYLLDQPGYFVEHSALMATGRG